MASLVSSAVAGVTGIASGVLGNPEKVQFIPSNGGTAFQLDVSVSEEHSRDSVPTQFPVEDGSNISDHIFISPFQLSITGVISDTPLGTIASYAKEALTSAASALAPPLGIVVPSAAYALYSALQKVPSPSVTAYAQLLKLQAGDPTTSPPTPPQPFDVLTKLYRYSNMVIKSISVPRDAGTGTVLKFTAVMQELLIVAPQRINVQIFANPAVAASEGKLGKQQGELINGFPKGIKYVQSITGVTD